jgi:hypothetical protein
VTGQTDLTSWFQLPDPNEPFSSEFQKDLQTLGVRATSLRDLAVDCKTALGFSQTVANAFVVTYEHKGKRIGTVKLQYDQDWFLKVLVKFGAYWKGSAPRGVPPEEGWKCNLCSFADVCTLSRRHVRRK